jgi:hypothetical protein
MLWRSALISSGDLRGSDGRFLDYRLPVGIELDDFTTNVMFTVWIRLIGT